jgi:hypothetical protein
VLEALASAYEELAGPPGIPWQGLIADGHGIEENGYDPAYMDYMLKASSEFFGVIGSLSPEFIDKYRNLRTDEGRASVTRIMAVIDQMSTDVWQAVKDGDWNAFVALPRTTTVDAFSTIAANAANAAYLHYDGVMEAAMRAGKVSPDDVMKHATSATKVFQTFVDLDKSGHLSDMKKSKPVAGLGVAPAIVAALIALGVVVVLALVYLIMVTKVGSDAQAKALEWCDKVAKEGSKEDAMACVNAAASMQKNGNANLGAIFAGALTPIVAVLAIGAAFWMLPTVIQGIRRIRAA